jgi:hypothetical protein
MTLHDFPLDDVLPPSRGARSWVATFLRAASRSLDALAERLAWVEAAAPTERVLEFHGDAGAPEGALYINGQLVGHVLGVTRL